MKKKKILALVMVMLMIISNVMVAYAEETLDIGIGEWEKEEVIPVELSVDESEVTEASSEDEPDQEESESPEPILYEIQDISFQMTELELNRKLSVTATLNTTEGIENAVVTGVAYDKGSKVQYECTSISDTEITFEMIYGETEADDYVLETLTIYTLFDEQIFELEEYGNFSYTVYSNYYGDFLDGIAMFTTRKPQFTGVNGDDGRFVIVLDPGHDPVCTDRAWVNGVWEPDLNWRMAEALKAELEKYAGVEVYINRTWEECPGVVDVNDDFRCLEMRVVRAADLEADLLISLHNNAAGNGVLQSSAHGAVIYITRYPGYQPESEGLAQAVLSKLEGLGLRNNGIKTRYYGDDATDTYDDGTGWDWYAINRHSTLMGIPSLLIEHAFMDNLIDLEFLRTDEMVNAIGKADAQAIVEYYGLQLAEEVQTNGDMKVIQGEDEYIYLDITNVSASYEVEKVCVSAWSDNNGKDDLIWYDAVQNENGWTVTVDLKRHNMDEGTYYFDLCFVDQNGVKHLINSSESKVDMTDELIDQYKRKAMHRLYNPYTSEHFYTSNTYEKDYLVEVGWSYEGIAWYAPVTGVPVYRLYNPYVSDHHYTLSAFERDHLVSVGWSDEGIGWYSDPEKAVIVYRLYNPYTVTGMHHYTTNYNEVKYLSALGWHDEGIGWYGAEEY